jgi:hypothetical protein
MSSVSETIVREYFELHEFLVRQHRKYIAQTRREEDDIDFFVLNPQARPREGELPFVIGSGELPFIARAIVVVKGWHTETFSSARLESTPEIFRFVPALPQSEAERDKSIALLRSKGVDAVIPFRTMLADLVDRVEANRNYQKSDVLQVIRILKNYDFFKEPQMELFKPRRKRK